MGIIMYLKDEGIFFQQKNKLTNKTFFIAICNNVNTLYNNKIYTP